MKTKKLLLFIMTLIVALLVPLSAFADLESNDNNDYYSVADEYAIDSYDVNIKVSEDNTYTVVEKIDADFYTAKHGIFRKIPTKNEVVREDGTTSSVLAAVKDIKVDGHNFTTYNENGYRVIQIGNEDTTLVGKQNYTISYTYSLSKDVLEDSDEFYYNIIGTEWDTTISNVTFNIEMPKDFDESKLGLTRGRYGSTTSDISFSTNEKTISGSFSGTLGAYEGITARLELEQGYFTDKTVKLDFTTILMFVIPVICALAMFALWFLFGKDDKAVQTVEFYPPDNLNSLEIARWYKGDVDKNDAISLLIYLASKGYVGIKESKKDYFIIKVKEYDGNDENEERFFKDLFKKGKIKDTEVEENGVIKTVKAVKLSKLKESFYSTLDIIVNQCATRKSDIFVKGNTAKSFIAIPLILATVFAVTMKPTLEYYGELNDFFAFSLLGGLVIAFGGYVLFSKGNFFQRIVGLLIVIFGVCVFAVSAFSSVIYQPFYLYPMIVGIIAIIFISLFFVLMPKRNAKGREMLGRIKGFKEFLETAEKDKLEQLVEETPEYFYNILPYAYVLGVSDKWSKKFESLAIEPPNWYYGYDTNFNTVLFYHSFNHAMRDTTSAMISRPVQTSSGTGGGGFSGGGFSGGGVGGGGGGSW